MGSGARKARQSVTQASNKDRKAYELAGDLYGVTGFFFWAKMSLLKISFLPLKITRQLPHLSNL